MKLGLSFPQTEIGTDPIVIKDFLQAAEELGYDFVTFVDNLLSNPLLKLAQIYISPMVNCTAGHYGACTARSLFAATFLKDSKKCNIGVIV